MIQVFLLSEIYLVLCGLLLLMDSYRSSLSFLLRFRAFLQENPKSSKAFFLFGLITGILMLCFPASPGPIVLGDLIPSLAILSAALYFKVEYSESNDDKERAYAGAKLLNARKRAGYVYLAIAILHFILPSFVLL